MTDAAHDRSDPTTAPLSTVAREWTRIGVTGFGGPPAHIALLRRLMVDRRRWMDAQRVRGRERGLRPAARPGLDPARDLLRLPGRWPAGSDRRRARVHPPRRRPRPRAVGAVLRTRPAALGARRRRGRGRRRRGRGRRCGALAAACRASSACATTARRRARWIVYLAAAAAGAALIGPYLVLVLLACGLVELALQRRPARRARPALGAARSRSPRRPWRWAGSARCAGRRSRSARSPTAAAS